MDSTVSVDECKITNLKCLSIKGASLTITKSIHCKRNTVKDADVNIIPRVLFVSSRKNLQINARIVCPNVTLIAEKNVIISSSSIVWCSQLNVQSIKLLQGFTRVDGKILSYDRQALVSLKFETNLSTGIDSVIGSSSNFNAVASSMLVEVAGDLNHHGLMKAKNNLKLIVKKNYVSFENPTTYDTAPNCFDAKLELINADDEYSIQFQQKMQQQQQQQGFNFYPKRIAQELQDGYDPKVPSFSRSGDKKAKAIMHFIKEERRRKSLECPKELGLCESLLDTWSWKSGRITCLDIEAIIGDSDTGEGDLLDCCQLQAQRRLCLNVAGNATVRKSQYGVLVQYLQ